MGVTSVLNSPMGSRQYTRFWLPWLLAAVVLSMSTARAAGVGEYDLKAAFLYNFAVFTEWPEQTPAGMNVCVLGTDPFGSALDHLKSKQVRSVPVVVQRITGTENIRGCHVLFISASERERLTQILDAARTLPVLTVADMKDAASNGVMIGLVMQEQRVTFEINVMSARAARLSISSKLIKLARNVYTP